MEIFFNSSKDFLEKSRQESIQSEKELQKQTSIENDHKGLRWTESGISEGIRLNVQLEKDPTYGLGLTLVDGVVNGVKGVYVKSVSNQGDGKRKGLIIGDCLQSVNGISLVDKTRHDAVNLVKDSGQFVDLEILRFPLISEVLGANDITNGSDSVKKSVPVIVHQPDTNIGHRGRRQEVFPGELFCNFCNFKFLTIFWLFKFFVFLNFTIFLNFTKKF